MNAEELSVDLRRDIIDVCIKVNGLDTQRSNISREKGGEALAAWLEDKVDGNVLVRIRVADADDMYLAFELARIMASAGHTVSVGNLCQFKPARSMNQE